MKRFTLALVVTGAFALAAHAGDPAEKFAEMDVDTDGLVTDAEFLSWTSANTDYTVEEASAKFAELAGEDGVLTLDELEAAMAAKDAESKTAETE